MAVIERVENPITVETYVENSIEYITRQNKAAYIHYENCMIDTPYKVAQQFALTRSFYNKNNKILAHHFSQSFPDEDKITAAKAHEIGIEYAKRVFPGYQVIVSTHIDGSHIHNHFFLNSVNLFNGNKYHSNKTTLNNLRSENDKICLQNKLSVLKSNSDNSEFKGIDQATLQLAKKGKSWKYNLVQDLDEGLSVCKSKNDFIDFFKNKNYEIKYKDIHITFKKINEKKGIRADTLAKQFGSKYSKKNIDAILGVEAKTTVQQKKNKKSQTYRWNSEWERFEEDYFKNSTDIPTFSQKWITDAKLFAKDPFQFTLHLIALIFSKKKYKVKKNYDDTKYRLSNQKPKEVKKVGGNVSYKALMQSAGNTTQIKIYAWQLPKIISQPFFHSYYLDICKGTATVTLKEKDLDKVTKALNISDASFFRQQSETIKNKKTFYKLKSKSTKLNYLLVTKEQLAILQKNYCEVAYFSTKDDEKVNIAYLPNDKKHIFDILYPEKINNESASGFYQQNYEINRELKEIADKTNDKVCYKKITTGQLATLRSKTQIKFAAFRKEGFYNLVYLEKDKQEISICLGEKSEEKKQKIRE